MLHLSKDSTSALAVKVSPLRVSLARHLRMLKVPRLSAVRHDNGAVAALLIEQPRLAVAPVARSIREAFEVLRRLAGQPIIPAPGQDLLDDLITKVLAA